VGSAGIEYIIARGASGGGCWVLGAGAEFDERSQFVRFVCMAQMARGLDPASWIGHIWTFLDIKRKNLWKIRARFCAFCAWLKWGGKAVAGTGRVGPLWTFLDTKSKNLWKAGEFLLGFLVHG
jgi:hypothetical protein